jgi:N-acetylneuraminic acid mutarotase
MPVGLYNLAAHTIGDRIYIIGGYGRNAFTPVVLAYDPASDTWSERSPRPAYNYIFMSAAAGGRVFVVGGQGTIDNGPWASGKPWITESRVDIYDPETDRWSTGRAAPAPIAAGVACADATRVYVFGESLDGTTGDFAYAYDIATDAWAQITHPAIPRNGQACVAHGGEFYIVGGRSAALRTESVDRVEIYSPLSDRWRDGIAMAAPRYWSAATSTQSGLLVFGGVTGTDEKTVDLVDMLELHPGEPPPR